jgi:hypothetical protein
MKGLGFGRRFDPKSVFKYLLAAFVSRQSLHLLAKTLLTKHEASI